MAFSARWTLTGGGESVEEDQGACWEQAGSRLSPEPAAEPFWKLGQLTRRRRLTDEVDQVFLDGVKGVKVVHDKDVPLTGLGGDLLQLVKVHVGHANGEDAVTWQQ